MLAVGDGALGFWKALWEVFPTTRDQRCRFHVESNVLATLPKTVHPGAIKAMKQIYMAEDGDAVRAAIKAFADTDNRKYPKAAAKIVHHADVLLEFFNYPSSIGSI